MGHDARPRLEVRAKFRNQSRHESRQQVKRYDTGVGETCLEQVLLNEPDTRGEPFARGLRIGAVDEILLQLDTDTACAIPLRGGHHEAPVARTQVIYDV